MNTTKSIFNQHLPPLADRLRPQTIDDFVGQEHLVGSDKILSLLSKSQKPFSMIFWGPPGVGKTTLAHIISVQLNRPFYTLSAISSGVKDVREVIRQARQSVNHAILFIDEIHRLGKVVEEVLYPAMEEFALDIVIGKGPSARSIRLKLPPSFSVTDSG